MRRPLVWVCLIYVILVIAKKAMGDPEGDSLFFPAVENLKQISDTENLLQLTGNVAEIRFLSEGIQLSIDQIAINEIQTNSISIQEKNNTHQTKLDPVWKILIQSKEISFAPGDQIEVSGRFVSYKKATNPGEFDFYQYYKRQKILGHITNSHIRLINSGQQDLKRTLYTIRKKAIIIYRKLLGEKTANTVSALCLGERKMLDQEMRQIYQEGGIAHIFAISGLHISMLGISLFQLLRRSKIRFSIASFISGLLVLLYIAMIDSGISSKRALVMFLIWLGAQACGRKYDAITAMCVAAALLVTSNAESLTEPSFLLSFLAVFCVIFIQNSFFTACNIQNKFIKLILGGVVLWMGMLPATLWFFYQTSISGIALNLFIVPLVTVLLASGFISVLAGFISIAAGQFLAAPVYYLLSLIDVICIWTQKIVDSVWIPGRPKGVQIVLILSIWGMLLCISHFSVWLQQNGKRKKTTVFVMKIVWGISFILMLVVLNHRGNEEHARITCLDVGQGDSAVLQLPGNMVCMIDGGSTSENDIWNYVIENAIKYDGIQKIDYLFLSHGDADHVNGITAFLESYESNEEGKNINGITLGKIILPFIEEDDGLEKIRILAQEKNIPVAYISAGNQIGNEIWSIECLSPEKNTKLTGANEKSIVLRLTYGKFRMLFMGDAGEEAEQQLVKKEEDLHCNVLKAGHHGSRYSTTELFLKTALPDTAIISCGSNNPYGHPAKETLERLEKYKCSVLQTSETGAVIIDTDGMQYSVHTFLQKK